MARDHEPCIGVIELASIARGVAVTDALLKEASVRPLFARPFSPGKYAVLFTGSVGDCASALRRGLEIAGSDSLGSLLLPSIDRKVLAALDRPVQVPRLDAVGIVETSTIPAALLAADAAVKRDEVELIELRLAQGIGGKCYFTLCGEVAAVESATLAAQQALEGNGALLARIVIPRAHDELREWLGRHEDAP
jgi:microcompartment protein CcmL/EutN